MITKYIKKYIDDFATASESGSIVGRATEKYDRGEYGEVVKTLETLRDRHDLRKHTNHIYVFCLMGSSYVQLGHREHGEAFINRAFDIHQKDDTKKTYNLSKGAFRYLLEFLAYSLEQIDQRDKALSVRNDIETA